MENIFFAVKFLLLQLPHAFVVVLVGLLLLEGLMRALGHAVRGKRIEIPMPTQDSAS